MKKSWIEMVQDYVDARMAVGGCLLGIILFGLFIWSIIDMIRSIISNWSDAWPLYVIIGSLGLIVIGVVLVVQHSSDEKFHRNTALVVAVPLLLHVASVIVVFASGDRLSKLFYGSALILMTIAYLIVLLVQIYLHKQQQ